MKIQQLLETSQPNRKSVDEQNMIALMHRDGSNAAHHLKQFLAAGSKPSEEFQKEALLIDGYCFSIFVKAGIVPSEEAQLAMVLNNGAIEYITRNNITPSERVQKAAIDYYHKLYQVGVPQLVPKGQPVSECIQIYIATKNIQSLADLDDLSLKVQSVFLSNPKICCADFIHDYKYEELVNKWVKNPRSQKKWIKYRDAVRKYYDLYPNEYKKDMEQWKQTFNEYINSYSKELQ